MRIAGTKYCGHDSALCLLDTDKKTVFAISTERVTSSFSIDYFVEILSL